MLRKSSAPLDILTITLRFMEEREVDQSDKKLVKTIQKRVGPALRLMRDRVLVVPGKGAKGLLMWDLKGATPDV